MSMHIGGATVAVIHSDRGSMDCEAYPSKLAAVLKIINNGGLGHALGGIGYGSDEHQAALVQVEQQIAATRASIAEMLARDSKNLPALDSEEPDLVYSVNGEDFSYETLGELIDWLRAEHDDDELIGREYFVGVKQQQSASHYFRGNVDSLIEMASERAYEDAPEHSDDFAAGVKPEAIKELDDLIKAWADKYVEVTFWTVEHVEKKQLTEEDLE